LLAGYSKDAKLFFPDGVVVEGRAALRELDAELVKPREVSTFHGSKLTFK
jgi:hypothetical protein